MKIVREDAVYVQKNDIVYLTHTEESIPASIFTKVFGGGIVIIDDRNRYEFIKFEEKSEIEFFKNLDWIIDYDSVKDLTEEQFIEMGQEIAEKKNEIAKVFNAMSNSKREKNLHMVSECEKLDHKMYSLRDVLWFKQGFLKFILPEDIDSLQNIEKVEEKGFMKVFKRFKKPSNN